MRRTVRYRPAAEVDVGDPGAARNRGATGIDVDSGSSGKGLQATSRACGLGCCTACARQIRIGKWKRRERPSIASTAGCGRIPQRTRSPPWRRTNEVCSPASTTTPIADTQRLTVPTPHRWHEGWSFTARYRACTAERTPHRPEAGVASSLCSGVICPKRSGGRRGRSARCPSTATRRRTEAERFKHPRHQRTTPGDLGCGAAGNPWPWHALLGVIAHFVPARHSKGFLSHQRRHILISS
jgi:hypothetical protein